MLRGGYQVITPWFNLEICSDGLLLIQGLVFKFDNLERTHIYHHQRHERRKDRAVYKEGEYRKWAEKNTW